MTAPVLVVFPGASLMDIREVPGGLEVRCPGCGATQHYQVGPGQHETFVHEDGCYVHARIQKTILRYQGGAQHG